MDTRAAVEAIATRETGYDDPTLTKEYAIATALTEWAHWNGLSILEIAAFALEDANFHEEAAAVREMLEKYTV